MTNEPEVVDADVVPDQPNPDDAQPVPGQSLERVEQDGGMGDIVKAGAYLGGNTPREIIQTAKQIADPLKELVEGAGLVASMGGNRKHVEVGGWQALGAMLGALGGQPLHAETIWARPVTGPDGQPTRTTYTATVRRYYKKDQGGGLREEVTYDVDGYSWEAAVEVRTAAGVVVGRAEGMCSRDEETWNDRSDFALRSMAETRAESRAYRRAVGWIISLAGYSPTPAEEMAGGANGGGGPPAPGWAEEASADRKRLALDSLTWLLGDTDVDRKVALDSLAGVKEALGVVPEGIAVALSRIARVVQESQQNDGPEHGGAGDA